MPTVLLLIVGTAALVYLGKMRISTVALALLRGTLFAAIGLLLVYIVIQHGDLLWMFVQDFLQWVTDMVGEDL